MPAITHKIDKDLPQYRHDEESDVFILTSAEDLVPVLNRDRRGNLIFDECERNCQTVKRHRSRSEGLFLRIELAPATTPSSRFDQLTR